MPSPITSPPKKCRRFNKDWEEAFYFVETSSDTLSCLLCPHTTKVFKKYNLDRHFDKIHNEYKLKHLPGSIERKLHVATLKSIKLTPVNSVNPITKEKKTTC